jgi:hypothetical protein
LAQDVKTVSDFEGERVRYRVVEGGVAPADFAKMAADFLGPGGVTLGVLTAYGSPQARAVAGAADAAQCDYESWRSRVTAYDRTTLGCPEVQQAIKIGSSVVVRRLGKDCRRSREAATNPLDLMIGGASFETLHVMVGSGGAARFYVRTDRPPTGKLAKSVLSRLTAATGVRNLTVTLRADKWFYDDCGFPAFFPFEDVEIPSRQAYLRTKSAICAMDAGGSVQCAESVAR